jgi:hypothetical protein
MTWWTMAALPGRTLTPMTCFSSAKGHCSRRKQRSSLVSSCGTGVYGRGMRTMTSTRASAGGGGGIDGGAPTGSPSGAPASSQRKRSSRSASGSERLSL